MGRVGVTPQRRRWQRLRRWLLTAVATLLVSAAVLLALGRLALPWLIDSPERVAGWLGERIGRSVVLEGVQARWDGPGPVLDLEGLQISAAPGEPAAITLGRARVQIDVYAWLLPGRHLIRDFLLVDANVDLTRDSAGQVAIEGFGARGQSAGGLASWLGRVGNLGISRGRLTLDDRAADRHYTLDRVELRISQHGDDVVIGVQREGSAGRGHLRAVVELPGPVHWPLRAARLYVEAEDFPVADLGTLLQPLALRVLDGRLDGQQWFSWAAGRADSLRGDWQIADLVLAAPEFPWGENSVIEPNLHLEHGRLLLEGASSDAGFILDLAAGGDDEPAALPIVASLRHRREEQGGGWRLTAEQLPVALLAGIGQLAQPLAPTLRSRLYAAQPQGTIAHLEASSGPAGWALHGNLDALSMRAAGARWPQVQGLEAQFSMDAAGLALTIDDDAVEVAIPGVLRAPVALTQLRALIGAHPEADGWALEVVDAELGGAGFSAGLQVSLTQHADLGPVLQFAAHVPEASIEAAKAFWVLNKMPPRTVAWLDRALGAGRVVGGDVQFRGPLREWPFREQQGHFEARFAVEDAALDYHADWPRADDLSAEVAFINTSMVIERATGKLGGARVLRGRGAIASLKDPVLELDLGAEGDGAGWLEFLKATPVRRNHADVLFGMALAGPVDVGARLHLPLRKDLGPSTVAGEALIKGAHYTDAKWNLDFTEVHGRVDFSESGFSADQLRLQLGGENAELAIAVGAFTSSDDKQVQASLSGKASAQSLFGQYEQLDAILAQVNGVAEWDVSVDVPKVPAGQVPATVIRYATNLAGIAIGFPVPLGKPAETALPLALEVHLPLENGPPLRLDIGPQARLFAEVGTRDRDFRGQLQFGPELAVDLPTKGLRVSGEVDSLDPAAWAGWIFNSAAGDGEDSILADLSLRVGPDKAATSVVLERSKGPWVLRVDGPEALGSMRFESAAGRPAALVANFERLHLPEPTGGGGGFKLTPDLIPTLHLWVGDLSIGAAKFGEARLEAFSTDHGLRVDLLEARSKDLEIHAKGDWTTALSGPKSRFEIRMTSEDLGRMLSGLGFAGVIEGGQTLARIDASWAGAPFDFALERLTGAIDISVGRGRFLDVDPGAGRIFGLLSLRELPRRLTLDFRDLFQSGMSFDRIEGRFALADGNAWTEDLTVRGPAADILIIGRTGLASRDYDQQVMVAPHMSRVLPVLGGLAAGPVGAAAGFLAQGMVAQNDDIEKTSRVHYSVAGSWEKPVVARLSPIRPDVTPRRREGEAIRPG